MLQAPCPFSPKVSGFDAGNDKMMAIETQIGVHQPGEAGHEQSTDEQHDEAERCLRSHQGPEYANAINSTSAATAPRIHRARAKSRRSAEGPLAADRT
jgi:hypothetical protein